MEIHNFRAFTSKAVELLTALSSDTPPHLPGTF